MSYPLQAVSANAIAAVLLCSLLVNARRKYRHRSLELNVFKVMLHLNLFQCIVEPITIVLDRKLFPGAVPLMTTLNALLYICTILFTVFWSVYADVRVHSIRNRRWRMQSWKYVPGAVIVLGSFANLFTPVFFHVTAENVYERTDLFFLPFAVSYFYLISGTISSYGLDGKSNRYVFLPALTFLTPVFLTSIVQVLIPGVSLLWVGAAIGLNSAYISLLDESASIDPLSGAYSRHYLNQYLESLPKVANEGKIIAGLMLDIDQFKSINDRFGHLVGDDAISNVGDLLRRVSQRNGQVFRYAGDEFTILMPIETTADITTMVQQIHEETKAFNESKNKPYQLSFSIGRTVYIPGESSNTFLQRMDESMYKEKKQKIHE